VLTGQFTLQVSNVPGAARGGAVFPGTQQDLVQSLTNALRAGTTTFTLGM
jgi:hypothetical protein